jgi:glycosyltransferase involved in cell wall biosynthesis
VSDQEVIRILLLAKGLGPGGAERLLVEQTAARSADIEYEVAYLLPWKNHLVPEIEALGVPTHCLGVRTEADPRWAARLEHRLRSGGFDVVHAHAPLSAAVARVQARLRRHRLPFVYTEHNRWPSYHWATRAANRATYRLNDAVFAVSEDVRDSVAPRLRGRVEVLVHGVDLGRVRRHLEDRAKTRADLGVRDEELLVVTVANYREHKGYPFLLLAAAALRESGAPIRFAVVGQGQLQHEVEALHAELGLDETVQLLGYQPDAVRFIAAADVFCLASLHEGLPVSVMESLACGVPVVATAVGGLPQAVTNDVDGLLVEPGDAEALAAALRSMLDGTRRARMARAALKAGERFSSRHAVERIERTYRRLITRQGASASESTAS